jgi:multidrug efflux system outer membrane protein
MHRASLRLILVAVAGLFGLAGCAGKWPAPAVPAVELPAARGDTPARIDRQWWRAFHDPRLDALVDEALVHNFDLAKAAANVAEARASAGMAQAQLTPRVDALGKVSGSQRQVSLGEREDINKLTGLAAAGIGVGWEIDLWGRIEQMNAAALARVAASEHTRNAVTLSVSSAVVETYFQMLGLDANLRLMGEAQRSLAAVTDLERRRWRAGVGTEQAYRQSLAELAATEAQIPGIESALTRTELALQQLVGRSPRRVGESPARAGEWPRLPEMPHDFAPERLLTRPDVASAEQLLAAAQSDVNATRAEQLPRLNLSVLAGLVATSTNVISGFPLYADVTAGIGFPLFDGGLQQAKVDGAEARRERAEIHYRYTLTVAFREVYEALAQRDASDREVVLTARAVEIREQSLRLTEKSYQVGRSSKFEVLSETIKVLDARTTLNGARQRQFAARSQLSKALGGGF